MSFQNINLTKKFIYILSFITFIYQLILFDSIDDFICILTIFISMIFTTYYCFNDKYFFDYPISLSVIFVSHFINLGGALFLKSFELTPITDQLRLPVSTISNLALFNLLIILSHVFYRNISAFSRFQIYLRKFFVKLDFFNDKNQKFLYILTIIAITTRILYLDLDTPIEMQIQRGVEGPSIIQDLFNGLRFLIFLPVIIFFSNYLYQNDFDKKKNIFFFIFIIFIIFLSISRNSRSLLFDTIFLSGIIFFILFLFDKIKSSRALFIKFILFIVLLVPTFNFFETLSSKYLIERSFYLHRSPIDNVKTFFSNVYNSNNLSYVKGSAKISESDSLFRENFYNNLILNRVNILLVHDNFNYINEYLNQRQKDNLKKLQINKIISILPQPIIKIFNNSFNKSDYNKYSTASYLYGKFDYERGNMAIGSAIMTVFIMFGKWTYFLFLFIFIPFFIIFDSFYISESKKFSPYILIFLYSTYFGILNFFVASDISYWFALSFRHIPETLVMIVIIQYFYKKFFTK